MTLPVNAASSAWVPSAGERAGVRAAAYLIDSLAAGLAIRAHVMVEGFLLGFIAAAFGRIPTFNDTIFKIFTYTLAPCLTVVYFILCESLYGATLGKVIFGMRVVMSDGSRCTPKAAAIRGVIRVGESLFLGLPAVLSMKEPLNQRWGDKAAGTVVAKTRGSSGWPTRSWRWLAGAILIYLIVAGAGAALVLTVATRLSPAEVLNGAI